MRALTLALFTAGCVANATFEHVDDTAPDDPVDPNVVYEARLLATAWTGCGSPGSIPPSTAAPS